MTCSFASPELSVEAAVLHLSCICSRLHTVITLDWSANAVLQNSRTLIGHGHPTPCIVLLYRYVGPKLHTKMTQNAPKQPISTYKLTKFSGEGVGDPSPLTLPHGLHPFDHSINQWHGNTPVMEILHNSLLIPASRRYDTIFWDLNPRRKDWPFKTLLVFNQAIGQDLWLLRCNVYEITLLYFDDWYSKDCNHKTPWKDCSLNNIPS